MLNKPEYIKKIEVITNLEDIGLFISEVGLHCYLILYNKQTYNYVYGSLTASRNNRKWIIDTVYADKGFGPLLYDLFFSYVSNITSDYVVPSLFLTDEAKKIWDYYDNHRKDIVKIKKFEKFGYRIDNPYINSLYANCLEDKNWNRNIEEKIEKIELEKFKQTICSKKNLTKNEEKIVVYRTAKQSTEDDFTGLLITRGLGEKSWYENGLLHRLGGPAVELQGYFEYWIDGVQYIKEQDYWNHPKIIENIIQKILEL